MKEPGQGNLRGVATLPAFYYIQLEDIVNHLSHGKAFSNFSNFSPIGLILDMLG